MALCLALKVLDQFDRVLLFEELVSEHYLDTLLGDEGIRLATIVDLVGSNRHPLLCCGSNLAFPFVRQRVAGEIGDDDRQIGSPNRS